MFIPVFACILLQVLDGAGGVSDAVQILCGSSTEWLRAATSGRICRAFFWDFEAAVSSIFRVYRDEIDLIYRPSGFFLVNFLIISIM
jgi:hypothetical protein